MDTYFSQSQVQRMQQVLAPQMRQSLEMLQVPMMELRTLIAQELAQNPTLEELTPESDTLEVESDNEFDDISEREFDEEFEVLARLDDAYRDSFMRGQVLQRPGAEDEARRRFQLESITQECSLQEHLINQLSLLELDPVDRQLAEMLVGSINDAGYLATSLTELAENTGFDEEHLEYVLHLVQELDPVGVACRDLSECLLKQIDRMGMRHLPAARIVEHYIPELAAHKYQDIARALKIPVDDVQEAARFIATLEPKPGRQFVQDAPPYVMPEVFVTWHEGAWRVTSNDEQLPQLRISNHYRNLMADESTSRDVKHYIRDKVRASSFMIKSIGQRQQTIRNIAEEIVKVQQGFLEEGVSALKPLTMSDVADKLGIHETTVSRAIANKYMETPRGVFEMKYFFTPGFTSSDGTSMSNKSIKDAIQQLVAAENPAKPLSDQAMVKALADRGIEVARRTIAKYRDELHILPSHLRRQS